MLVVGEESVYLSHLPMFMSPHNYQVILEATFTKDGEQPQTTYVEDRQRTGAKVYTLNPERFVLTDLKAAHPGGVPLRHDFKGDVFRHHFEREEPEPVALGKAVKVDVENVVYFQELDPGAAKPAEPEYLLFGKGSKLFLAHVIVSPPDFDHVLSAKVLGQQLAADQLRTGVRIVFPGRANDPRKRLKEGERLPGSARLAGSGTPGTLEVEIGTELYFEANELREAM